MEARDRRANLALFVAAMVAWIAVGVVVTTLDPRTDPVIAYVGAGVMGIAIALTTIPLFWLGGFARQRRIAYLGDWIRAIRRGAWAGGLVAILVLLRAEGLFQLPIALFFAALVIVAEVSISSRR